MPRKKKEDEYAFFRTESGKISYHPLCLRCRRTCKQSWRVQWMECSRFVRR